MWKYNRKKVSPSATWVPPGHYYSPIVDPTDPVVLQTLAALDQAQLARGEDLNIDEPAMVELLKTLAPLCAGIPFPETKTAGYRYYFNNSAFAYGDGIIYYGMIRWLQPRRIIEVGAGYSSCLAMDTNDAHFDGAMTLDFIDPYPETLIGLLQEDDPYLSRIVRRRVQDVSLGFFGKLKANDILFIDSSHVSKFGSDVNDYMFRILPHLQDGVVIHVHDIGFHLKTKRSGLSRRIDPGTKRICYVLFYNTMPNSA